MKNCFILLFLITCFGFNSYAQQQSVHPKVYVAKITFAGRPSIKGILYTIDDSGIYICQDRASLHSDSMVNQPAATIFIPAIGIQQVFIRRLGSIGRGALVGAGIGVPLGLISDAVMSLTVSAVASILNGGREQRISTFPFGTISCTTDGAAIGAWVGSSTKHFRINQDVSVFQSIKANMEKYAFMK